MIKKQSVWALTLFSLILVLSVYYITLPNEMETIKKEKAKTTIKETNDNSVITTLKVENEEEKNKKTKELQEILNKEDATKEEKNNAYEELKVLNVIKGQEEEISLKIKDKYKLDNFVKITDDQVKVVLIKKDHTSKLANEIMEFVQSNFDKKMYISIKFETEKEQ
ncbi:MAG: SpoIIIAH-like family protein [Bacilli bacterium]|nr:SpoIIIAH-like family protein [Bacilli bacterium]